jgi:hypothetical protein
MPGACIGPTRAAVSAPNSRPLRLRSSVSRKAASSGIGAIASVTKASVNWITRVRSGTVSPGDPSLTQLCGRFGPVRTGFPGSNDPMKLPTKCRPEVRTT